MERPRKHNQQAQKGKKTVHTYPSQRPNTCANAKEHLNSSMETLDVGSEKTDDEYPDAEFPPDDLILSPTIALRDLQHQSHVRNDFNAWINSLSLGNDVQTHFQEKTDGNGNVMDSHAND